jgi:hydrogenase nickel incorporation protein HypA/HybF
MKYLLPWIRKTNMHEVSIAAGMIEEIARIASENKAKKIISVNLKIGKRSGIVIDSLMFAFDAIKMEHPFLSSTDIVIEEIPLRYLCRNCNAEFRTDDVYFPSCPICSSCGLRLLSGEEMDIENMEIEI